MYSLKKCCNKKMFVCYIVYIWHVLQIFYVLFYIGAKKNVVSDKLVFCHEIYDIVCFYLTIYVYLLIKKITLTLDL